MANKQKEEKTMANEENLEKAEEFAQKLEASIKSCESGKKMLEASQKIYEENAMQVLVMAIADEETDSEIQQSVMELFSVYMQNDPINGVQEFAGYMDTMVNESEREQGKVYYMTIKLAAEKLINSDSFKEYGKAYEAFANDNSDEAKKAKKEMDKIQKQIQKETNIEEKKE